MLRPQDVGHRLVVRRMVGSRDGRPLFSDALGELVELTDTHLTLATARGPLRVALGDVHRAKRIPPSRRPSAADVVALELAADEAWPAPVRAQLGDWLLRAADNWTGRANSALPVGDPDRPLPEAVDAVCEWYATHGQPALVNTPLPLAAPVGAELDTRGWSASPPVLVQTAALSAVREAAPVRADLPEVELRETPTEDWLAVAAGRKGGMPESARAVLTGPERVRFARLHLDGQLVAVGRGTVTGPDRWLGLTLVEVVEAYRRRGLAVHVLRALVDWGAALGAGRAFLQVEQRNEPAVALYARLGFTTHHTYVTRRAPV